MWMVTLGGHRPRQGNSTGEGARIAKSGIGNAAVAMRPARLRPRHPPGLPSRHPVQQLPLLGCQRLDRRRRPNYRRIREGEAEQRAAEAADQVELDEAVRPPAFLERRAEEVDLSAGS